MSQSKTKKKGPFRIEAIIPITIIVILIGLYFKFYFDSHLRYSLEYGATRAHGAEVNIGRVKTNFLAPSIQFSNIQVTDKKNPQVNIIQIGSIQMGLLWDALLRGKFVVPEASILEIQTQSPRKRPGRVLPPAKGSKEKGAVAKATEKTLKQLEEKNQSNLLADLFSIAGGTNVKDQLKTMENSIASQKKIQQLKQSLSQKEKEWKKQIDQLPKESEIKQLVKKIESLKLNTKDPKSLKASFKQIDTVYREAKAKYKDVETLKKALKADVEKYKSEYQSLENTIQQDISHISQKLNIPSLNSKEINEMLLGNLVSSQLSFLYQYKDQIREYMPTKTASERKADKQSQWTPQQRSDGINYRFPKKKSPPRFWLKQAKISSTSKDGLSGDIMGSLKNLTNNPRHLGIPTTLEFKGDFPHQKIMGLTGLITVDHTTDVAVETGKIQIQSFPVSKKTLTRSKDVELGYNKARGSSKINFSLKEQILQVTSQSLFQEVDYYSKASDPNVERLLGEVTKDLDALTLNVKATGSWDKLSLNINSNLGKKLSQAITGQISQEINKAKKEVQNHIKGLVGKETQALKQKMGGIDNLMNGAFKGQKKALDQVSRSVDKKKKSLKKQGTKKLENKAKELLKKIKF